MTTQITLICDRCGKEADMSNITKALFPSWYAISDRSLMFRPEMVNANSGRHYDRYIFCPNCYKEFNEVTKAFVKKEQDDVSD